MAADRKIVFTFEGDTKDLESALRSVTKGTEKATKAADDYGDKAARASKAAKAGMLAVAAAAVAVAAGLAFAAKRALDFGHAADRMAKAARAVGASAEEYQVVVGAFDMMGITSEQTEAAIKKLGLRIGQVAAGAGGPAAEAFRTLGLTASHLEALPLPERMALLAEKIGDLGSQSKQAAVANAIFEESGLAMVGAFSQGGDAVRDASEKIRSAGIISNETAAEAEQMADAVTLLKRAWDGLVFDVLDPFVPVIRDIAFLLTDVVGTLTKTGEIKNFGQTLVDVFLRYVAPAAAYMAEIIVVSLASMKPAMLGATIAAMRLKASFLFLTFQVSAAEKMISKIQGAQDEWIQSVKDLGAVQETANAGRKDFIEGLKEIRRELGIASTEADRASDAVTDLGDALQVGVTGTADEDPWGLRDIVGLASEVASSIQSLFGQISGDISESIRDAQAQIDDLDQRIEASTDSREKRQLARRRTALRAQLEEHKNAAIAAFVVGKIAALSQAAVQAALAVITMLAQGGPPAAIAAGVAGGISIAAIAAEPPPTFHSGGMVGLGAPDEISARLLRSEAVLSPQGVRAAGGAGGVRDLNRGGTAGQQPVITVFKVRSRAVDAMVSDNLRTKQGPLVDALRAAQPRALGRHNPYSSS